MEDHIKMRIIVGYRKFSFIMSYEQYFYKYFGSSVVHEDKPEGSGAWSQWHIER